jgi:hypothetical protein
MTIETHGMQFVVDASGVAKGFGDYESAVAGVFKSLDQFEAKVASTMKSIESAVGNRAALSNFKKSLEGFSNINIDTKAAGKLSALSAAMSGFKAPSATQAANTRKFFTALEGLPDLSAAFRSIKNLNTLKSSMEGFKAPSLAQAKNLVEFARALEKATPAFRSLQRISGISGIANELASISIAMRGLKVPSQSQITNLGNFGLALQHLGRVNTGETGQMMHALGGINNFKAPTAANIRNLTAFANALHEIKPIPNATVIAEQMNVLANAATRANHAMGGFRGNLGAFNPAYGRFNAGTRQAHVEMMGLQNAFSGTFQVGSVLRSLLGSLTVAELGREFFQAVQAANQFRAALEVLGETPMATQSAWERMRADANHFGADLSVMSEEFSKFSLAAHENGVSLGESFKIYEGFQTVMTATHMGREQQQSVGLAIREMMDQGYVSTSRMTRQLGLVLPGALKTLNDAWKASGKTHDSIFTAMKKKEVDSTWALDVLAKHYKEKFGPAVEQALESPIQQFNILRNNIMQMMVEIGDAGAKKAFADLIKQISGYMDPDKTHAFAQAIGEGLTKAIHKLGEGIKFLHDHWDTLKGPLAITTKLLGEWMILSTAMKLGGMIFNVRGLVNVYSMLAGQLTQAITLTKALTRVQEEQGVINAATMGKRAAGFLKSAPTPGRDAAALDAAKLVGPWGVLYKTIDKTKTLIAQMAEKEAPTLASRLVGAAGAIGTAFSAVFVGLGIAWKAGTQAAEDNNIAMAKSTYSTADIIRGTWLLLCDEISGAWASVTKFVGDIWNDIKEPIFSVMKTVGHAVVDAFTFISYTAYTIVNGIIDFFVGLGKAVGTIMGQLGTSAKKLVTGDVSGAIAEAKLIGEGAGKAFTSSFSNMVSFADYKKATGAGAAALDQMFVDFENKAGRRSALDRIMHQKLPPKEKKPYEEDAPDKTDPFYHGTDGDAKKKKGKKGPDPYAEEKKLENAVDDLMKRLTGNDDPLQKLYNDFTTNIRKEAQDLLTLGGFKQFFNEVKLGSKDAAGQTQALIDVLQSGKGINEKRLSDLKARYGKDIPQLIQMLKDQLDDFRQAEVDAAAKQIEATNKGIIKARQSIGSFDPMTKLNDDMVGKMKPLAEMFFDKQDFESFYEPLVKGTATAREGLGDLRAAMVAAIDPTNEMHARFEKLGITGERLTQILAGMTQQLAYQQAQEEENLTFGAKLLRQKDEELMLMRLTTSQAEIMKDLQQEVNDKINAGIPVNASMIAKLKEELTVRHALADQMQRNKDFFENNGVRTYLNDLKDVGSAVNDLDKNFLQSLEDQLYSLGTTGKFSFKSIFDTIQQGIIRMASQGLVQNFTQMIFGKSQLEGGQPSIFGSTIGKMFGGYQAKTTAPLGSTKMNPLYVQWAGDFGAMSVGTKDGHLLDHPERVGSVTVGGEDLGFGGALNKVGTSPVNPMFVKDADRALTGGLGFGIPGAGTIGGDNGSGLGQSLFPVQNGVDPLAPLPDGGGVNGVVGTGGSPAAAAGAQVANSFKTNMASVIPMIGMMFASKFKSPIAQIGAMFLSMMLSKMMAGSAGGAGGGGGGGILGSILGAVMGGGGMTPGALEGGIVGSFVNSYRVHPASFVNAPHYREGTANTSGGIPAVLHDNEAVIPLSRGRKVPVELTAGSSRANGGGTTINFNVNSPDADSFRKSKQQVMTDLHGAATRSFARNNP